MSLYNNVEQFALDVALAHAIIHGDAKTSVETEGGLVDTFAKLMADLRALAQEELETLAILQRLSALETKPVPVPVQTVTASRTLELSDAGVYLASSSNAPITLALPAQASVAWPQDVEIHVQQTGTGQVSISAAAAVQIISEENLKTRKKGSVLTLKRLAENLWTVIGSLETEA